MRPLFLTPKNRLWCTLRTIRCEAPIGFTCSGGSNTQSLIDADARSDRLFPRVSVSKLSRHLRTSITCNLSSFLRRNGVSHQDRSWFDKIAQRFWTRGARPAGVRERCDRISHVGRANLFKWLRGIRLRRIAAVPILCPCGDHFRHR
jgi:hypothetical protein